MANQAELVFEIDSSGARTAATDLIRMNEASARAAGGADKLNRTLRDSQGRFKSSYDVAREYGGEVRSLADKYNPALSAVYKYQSAQVELNRAVSLGVLTQDQASSRLAALSSELQRSAAAANNYANGMRNVNNAQGSAGNQFAQLNDVVVTAWGGMNPALIGMQQGMQMVQGFAGQSLPQALSSLGGAFMQLLNPVTLLTIGAIAGGAALIQWGASAFSAGEKTKSLEDRLSDLEKHINVLDRLNKFKGTDGIDAIGEAYGKVTAQVMELIEAQRYLAIEQHKTDLAGILGTIAEDTGTTFWQSVFRNAADSSVLIPKQLLETKDRVENLQIALKITESDAVSLGQAMESAFNADNVQDQISKLATVREYLTIISQAGRDGADEARRMLQEITKAEDSARRLAAEADGLPASFAAASSASAKITDELNRAISAASRLAASAVSDARVAKIELDFRTDEVGKAGALAAAKFDEEIGRNIGVDGGLVNKLRSQAIEGAKETARIMAQVRALDDADRNAEKKGNSSSSRYASELNSAEKGFQSLRELMERDSMFQVAEYQKRQSQLDQALSQRLISEQNYQLMRSQLQSLYFGPEFEQTKVQYAMDIESLDAAQNAKLITEEQYLIKKRQLQWKYAEELQQGQNNRWSVELDGMAAAFDRMHDLAGGGYDELLKAQRVFGAASALISTYTGAAEALKQPFPMNIAAMGKVLTAGLGLVGAIKGVGSGGGSGGRSGGGGGGGSVASASIPSARAEPVRNTLIRLEGPDFMVDMADSIIKQIYDQSRDGRVIIQRG